MNDLSATFRLPTPEPTLAAADAVARLAELETPCHVLDLGALRNNLSILQQVQSAADCKILLALKGFATFCAFGEVERYLTGIAASGLHEAELGHESQRGEVHVYSPAYIEGELERICQLASHIVFNTPGQFGRFASRARTLGQRPSPGLRLNPEHREVATELYDPCAPYSRLGTTRAMLDRGREQLDGLEGLHFHSLCELGSDALERTLAAVEHRFGDLLSDTNKLRWVNMGGGHHITREGYDIERLVRVVRGFKSRYDVEVYLEPGEAIGLNAGVLVCSVLDVFDNGKRVAILDTSATAHMPDTLEMPYRPTIIGAGESEEFPYTYRLGGMTCLAGDVIGDYSFPRPLEPGDRLIFLDMAHYTTVKSSTFNGIRLPSIATYEPKQDELRVIRSFGYREYRDRLS